MFRGLLVLAVLENARSQIDVTALEEFSINFQNVLVTNVDQHYDEGCSDSAIRYGECSEVVTSITTGPAPDTIPSEHGTIALHARNVQLKTDSHLSFPTPFAFGPLPLSGLQVHEELHINGAAGQASFHVESPIVNLCFQLDGLPPVAVMMHDAIEQHLQQAEQMGASLPVTVATVTLDGEEDEGAPSGRVLWTQSSHPAFLWPPAHMPPQFQPPISEEVMSHVAVKFSNYSDSVGSQFAVRACEIESHTSSQSLLAAASPEARQFILHRIAQHQSRLLGVLRPDISNTHFNLMPLAMADLVVSAAAPCTNEELAQVPGEGLNTLQAAAFTLCSFAMGVAVTFAAISKKSVTPADDYHQVSA